MASPMGERLVIKMIKLPIFIADKGGFDMGVFVSIQEAQLQLEVIDVDNDEYVGYDAEGRLLRIETERDKVMISLAEDEPSHSRELEVAIRDYLKAVNEPLGSDPICSLASLVTVCQKFL